MFKAIFEAEEEDEDEEEEEEEEEEEKSDTKQDESSSESMADETEPVQNSTTTLIPSSIGSINMRDISRYLSKPVEDEDDSDNPHAEPVVGKIFFKKPGAKVDTLPTMAKSVAEVDESKERALPDVVESEPVAEVVKFTSLIRTLVAQKGSDSDSSSSGSSSEYEEVSASSKKSHKKSKKKKKKKKKHHKKKSKSHKESN